MKKKGLIISTVVMVVVLIASLTTATYAWFSVSSVTKIGEFSVSVVSDNAVNIGIKSDYNLFTEATGVSTDAFYTGEVIFSTETPGSMTAPGGWTGTTAGLSATLTHNINWGAQNKAVGVSSETSGFTDANTGYWTHPSGQTVVAANTGANGTTWAGDVAYANIGATDGTPGNYVHFILGVSPTTDLTTNKLIIMVEPTSGTSLGILASIHVAFRLVNYKGTSAGEWDDVDVYTSGNNGNTQITSEFSTNVTGDLLTAYRATYGDAATPKNGSYACIIDGLDLHKNEITQIELVIYLAGEDPDCNDQGKTSGGDIKLFFQTVKAPSEQK